MRRKFLTLVLLCAFGFQVMASESLGRKIIRTLAVVGPAAAVGLLHFSTQAEAAIRIIANGGGYAEMSAMSLLQDLDLVAAACEERPGLCDFEGNEAQLLEYLRSYRLTQSRNAQLEFFSDAKSKDEIRYYEGKPNVVGISSRHIYLENQEPAPVELIATLVASAWLMRQQSMIALEGSKFEERDLLSLAAKLARVLNTRAQTVQLSGRSAWTHVLKIDGVPVLVFESEFGTVEWTRKLTEAACGDRPGKISNIGSLHEDNGNILGRVAGTCDDKEFSAQVILTPPRIEPTIRLSGRVDRCESAVGSK